MDDLFTIKGAYFSPSLQYRYRLWRIWSPGNDVAVFLMLNPSTADESTNDPTVERCERRARNMGYGGLVVVNIFAYRATDPKDMLAQIDPVGPDNDRHIVEACKDAGIVICAWGVHGKHLNRGNSVIERLREQKIKLHCLGKTTQGQPRHPLYVGYDVRPVLMEEE